MIAGWGVLSCRCSEFVLSIRKKDGDSGCSPTLKLLRLLVDVGAFDGKRMAIYCAVMLLDGISGSEPASLSLGFRSVRPVASDSLDAARSGLVLLDRRDFLLIQPQMPLLLSCSRVGWTACVACCSMTSRRDFTAPVSSALGIRSVRDTGKFEDGGLRYQKMSRRLIFCLMFTKSALGGVCRLEGRIEPVRW